MTQGLAAPLEFPVPHPAGFPTLASEPVFDPSRHLTIEKPDQVISLAELGYSEQAIAECPTPMGVTSAFRLLSDEGVACLQEVTRLLEPYARGIERISRMVRGGVYQSKFLRDFCLSRDVTEVISEICDAPMLPHTMPHQLGHLNYNPRKVGENVDKWHADTLRIDYVMFVTDPNAVDGGEFQYFNGTKYEVEKLNASGQPLPADRVVSPTFPGAGYVVLQQGNMVVHRAKALDTEGERITLVNGYVPQDLRHPDYTKFDQLYLADPANIAASEYARHVAWMGKEALSRQLEDFDFSDNRQAFAKNLSEVAELLANAAEQIENADKAKMEHFGDS
ncbi:MAG: hypothetical protein AAGB04_21650 [Pseudomonadota bacterium]